MTPCPGSAAGSKCPTCALPAYEAGACAPGVYLFRYVAEDAVGGRAQALVEVHVAQLASYALSWSVDSLRRSLPEAQALAARLAGDASRPGSEVPMQVRVCAGFSEGAGGGRRCGRGRP